jgi:hypothetical protein
VPEGKPYLFTVARMRATKRRRDRFEYPDEQTYDPHRLFEGSFGIWQEPDSEPTEVELIFAQWPQMARRHTVLHGVLDGWCAERGDRGSRVEEIREMVRALRQGPVNGG